MAIIRATSEYSYEQFHKVIYIKGQMPSLVFNEYYFHPLFFPTLSKLWENGLKQNKNLYLQGPEKEYNK